MKRIKFSFFCTLAIIALCVVLVLVLAFSGRLSCLGINLKRTDNVFTKVVASATDTQLDPSARHLTIDMGATFMPGINYTIEVRSSTPFPVQTDVFFYNGEKRDRKIGRIPAGSTSASFSGKSPKIMSSRIRLDTSEEAQGTTVTLVAKKDIETVHELYDEILSLNGYFLPDYWKQHIDSKAEEIWARKVQLSSHSVEFFFMTDTHWKTNARNSPALLSYLTKKMPYSISLVRWRCGRNICSKQNADIQ